ncbi:MAG TPA: DUF4147 domain-containing protein [Candidatus Dormibacteraeota bacterium]|nr:DUF4147 domain-containing protein [Candidatus Dormibacteraeota bacterium]
MPDLKHLARQIFQQTLAAINIPQVMQRKLQLRGSRLSCIDPAFVVQKEWTGFARRTAARPADRMIDAVSEIDLCDFDELRAIAFGKAAHSMIEGLADILAPDFPVSGIVSAPTPPQHPIAGLQYFVAGHPVPTAASFEAGHAILDLLHKCDERTLIFFLISGGGSTLVELPLDPQLALEEVQGLSRVLVTCGASIDEINTVRKHLSAVKGGRLAAAAPRAMKLTYGVTDVPTGKESALASGPTIPDPTTVQDMERVLSDFALRAKLPAGIQGFLARGGARETPKPGDSAFARAQFQILLGMHDLFHAAHRAAEAAGFVTICDNRTDDWPLPQATDYLLDQLAQLQRSNSGRSVAVIADGEVSSRVTGNGVGGRNSAFVLDCVKAIAEKKIAVLSVGTDGVDGVSPAAGAVADGETFGRARAAGLDPGDYFLRSDSHTFFQRLDDAIVTGPTGNNLRDLRILLAGS